MIDDRIPYPSLGAGYPRSSCILDILSNKLGIEVDFYAMKVDEYPQLFDGFSRQFDNIKFFNGGDYGKEGLTSFLTDRPNNYSKIIVSRPHNKRKIGEIIRDGFHISTPIIFDSEAIGTLRTVTQRRLGGEVILDSEVAYMLRNELIYANYASQIWAVSENERQTFISLGVRPEMVKVVGHVVEVNSNPVDFLERQGLLFIGAMHSDNTPNSHSILWFHNNVLPLLNRHQILIPHLDVVGICSSRKVQEMQHPFLRLHGRVDNLEQFYSGSRVFIAPTHYAAGLPWKVTEAVSRGIPIVTTSLIANQVGLEQGVNVLIGDTPEEFAIKLSTLYSDQNIWNHIRLNALDFIKTKYSEEIFIESIKKGLLTDGEEKIELANLK